MELSHTAEQERFREEVRAWIVEAMPPEMRKRAEDGANFEHSEVMEWHKILFAKGWIAPNSGHVTGAISLAAFSFMVHDPRGIMVWASERSRDCSSVM